MQKSDCIIGVEHVSKFFGDKADQNDVKMYDIQTEEYPQGTYFIV